MKQKNQFRSVSIRRSLIDDVESIVHTSGLYRSIAEFISEAARLRIEQLTKEDCP